jgi:hypothetical protein
MRPGMGGGTPETLVIAPRMNAALERSVGAAADVAAAAVVVGAVVTRSKGC